MTGKINFALIGAGRMGARWINVLTKNKNASLKVILDSGSGKARLLASKIPGCKATTNLGELLTDKSIDAFIIATPHKHLSPISSAALKSGKHVLCEKPGAIKSSDIKKNEELSKKKDLVYMIGYNHRFHDGFIKARKLFKNGNIGRLIFIRAKYGFGGREGYNKEWRLNKEISGGGHLIDQGVHMIDLAISFLGKPTKVHGLTSDTFWKKNSEDNGFVILQNKNKVTASIHTSLTQWKPVHTFEIYGSKGYMIIDGLGPKYGDGEKLILGKPVGFTGEVKEKIIKCDQVADNSLALEFNYFLNAIKKDKSLVDSYAKDAYETLKIVETVYKNN